MSVETPFLYFEVLPPAPLRPYVHAYWGFDVRRADAGARHVVWPDGCLSLFCRVTPEGHGYAGFSGPRVEPLEVPVAAGESYRGVRLWPWAIRPLLDVEPSSVRDRNGPAAVLLGADAGALHAGLAAQHILPALEGLLRARAERASAVDAAVRAAAEAIAESAGTLAVAAAAAAAGLSERQLRRRFRAVTGLSPKEFGRVRRLRTTAAARMSGGEAWSRLAAQHGFADQAHLVREVLTMTGLTPRGLAERLQLIEHRSIRP